MERYFQGTLVILYEVSMHAPFVGSGCFLYADLHSAFTEGQLNQMGLPYVKQMISKIDF